MDGVCLSPTSEKDARKSGGGEKTSPRKSVVDVRRSKSSGSRRAEWKITKFQSMAGEATNTNTHPTTSSSSFPTSPVPSTSLTHLPTIHNHSSKGHLLEVMNQRYYSFGSNVTSNNPPISGALAHGIITSNIPP